MGAIGAGGSGTRAEWRDGRTADPVAAAALYHCITPVWGERFVERFIGLSLPSLLAPGNLPALPADRCLFHLLTRSQDVPRLEQSDAVRALRRQMPVEVETVDDLSFDNPYLAMTACHERACRRTAGQDVAWLFPLPDHIWSDGALRTMDRVLRGGARAVLVAGIRTRTEGAEEALRAWRAPAGDPVLAIPPRALVSVLLRYPHPTTTLRLCSEPGRQQRGRFFWDVEGHGLLARCTALLPLAVRPAGPWPPLTETIDGDFVSRVVPDPADIHCVEDSDDLCVLELSDSVHQSLSNFRLTPLTDAQVVAWMRSGTNALHRRTLTRRFVFHTRDLDADWDAPLHQSDALVDRLLTRFENDSPVAGRAAGTRSEPPAVAEDSSLSGRTGPPPEGTVRRILRTARTALARRLGSQSSVRLDAAEERIATLLAASACLQTTVEALRAELAVGQARQDEQMAWLLNYHREAQRSIHAARQTAADRCAALEEQLERIQSGLVDASDATFANGTL